MGVRPAALAPPGGPPGSDGRVGGGLLVRPSRAGGVFACGVVVGGEAPESGAAGSEGTSPRIWAKLQPRPPVITKVTRPKKTKIKAVPPTARLGSIAITISLRSRRRESRAYARCATMHIPRPNQTGLGSRFYEALGATCGSPNLDAEASCANTLSSRALPTISLCRYLRSTA